MSTVNHWSSCEISGSLSYPLVDICKGSFNQVSYVYVYTYIQMYVYMYVYRCGEWATSESSTSADTVCFCRCSIFLQTSLWSPGSVYSQCPAVWVLQSLLYTKHLESLQWAVELDVCMRQTFTSVLNVIRISARKSFWFYSL